MSRTSLMTKSQNQISLKDSKKAGDYFGFDDTILVKAHFMSLEDIVMEIKRNAKFF